jgi:hypothetical protein
MAKDKEKEPGQVKPGQVKPDPAKPKEIKVLAAKKPQAFQVPIAVRGAPAPASPVQGVDPAGRLPVISAGLKASVTIDNPTLFTVVGGQR